MKFMPSYLSLLCCLIGLGTHESPVFAAETAKPGTLVGFAERDITPELGMEQPGGYGKSYHRIFHDACKARAAVFDDGKKRVALVGLDALLVRRATVLAVRERIEKECGIAAEAILIAASHSHSSGPTGMFLPGEFDHASPFVQELAYKKSSCADAGYLKKVEDAIVEAVVEADKNRQPALCGVGRGTEDKAAFNRRFQMTNGLTYTHPGKGNPDIVRAAGPIDPEVGVIGVWDVNDQLIGCVVNYACHATTNPGGISANWIYYLEKTIRGVMGPDVVVVFLNGACGDITQVDNLDPSENPAAQRWARLVGGRVGAEAVKVLLSVHADTLSPIDSRVKVVTMNRRVPSKENLRKAMEIAAKDPKDVDPTVWTFAKETVLLDATIQAKPQAEVEVQAIQIGPAVFVTNPAEFFCQLGLDIKAKSAFPFTFPVELANGCVGYVPTEEALGPNGGGYETRLTSYSNLEPTAGTQMVNMGLELISSLTPSPIPAAPKAPPFRAPWTYGNVAPELE